VRIRMERRGEGENESKRGKKVRIRMERRGEGEKVRMRAGEKRR
jgi:hypothetical protein